MADITVTPADVQVADCVGNPTDVTYSVVVTAGEVLYKQSDGDYGLADCTDVAKSTVAGISVIGGSAGAPGRMMGASGDLIDIGGTVTKGEFYVLSDTAGKIMPLADLTVGQYVSLIGIGETTTEIRLLFVNSGVTHP